MSYSKGQQLMAAQLNASFAAVATPNLSNVNLSSSTATPTGYSSISTIGNLFGSLAVGAGSNPALSHAPQAGYAFGTLVSSAPATLANYYNTLAAAQAVYSFATSLTNYVDRCIIQAALNACTSAGGGNVTLPVCQAYLDTTLTWDPCKTSLVGDPSGGTVLLTQTCSTSPALSATGSSLNLNGRVPLQNISLWAFNAGVTNFPQSGSGVANTGYRSGSVALQIANCANGIFAYGVNFVNFDTPHVWSGSLIYTLQFMNCDYGSNNYGPNIGTVSTPATSNGIERLQWIGGGSGNNNYGVCVNVGTNSGSVFVSDMSIDYCIVRSVWYDALGGGNDCSCPLFIDRVHNESNGTTSGYTTALMYNNGSLFLTNVVCYWNDGTNPIGWVESGFSGRTQFANCIAPGQNSTTPAVYSSGSTAGYVAASGLTNRYNADAQILLQTSAGNWMYINAPPGRTIPAGNYPVKLDWQQRNNLLSGGGNLTVDPDATTKHAIGVTITFQTADGSTWTFVQGSGVTITSIGSGLTFGGKAGKVVGLTKTAANSWLACGAMT